VGFSSVLSSLTLTVKSFIIDTGLKEFYLSCFQVWLLSLGWSACLQEVMENQLWKWSLMYQNNTKSF